MCVLSRVQLFVTLMDYRPPGSSVHGILQQEYWSGLPFSSSGDLLNPGIEPRSPALQADSLLSEPPGKAQVYVYISSTRIEVLKGRVIFSPLMYSLLEPQSHNSNWHTGDFQ